MAKSPALNAILMALQSRPTPTDLSWEARRAGMEAMQSRIRIPDDVACEPADADGVPVEWIRVEGTDPDRVIFYLHGGGYTIGSISTHRSLMQNLGRAAGSAVLGVDYRLAPEHPFPAAVDDSIVAWEWLLRQDIRPASCVIGGDSAGGGLTLATLLRLQETGGSLPAAAVCLSPWTDLATAAVARETKNNDPMVTHDGLRLMSKAYAGQTNPEHPHVSPILADLAGLPPLLVQVGSNEHLLEDSTVFTERARAAGVEVDLETWDDMIHVFQAFPSLEESAQAIDRVGEFVRRHTS